MAQLVARDVWDVDAAGSNPVTPTTDAAMTAERAAKEGYFAAFWELLVINIEDVLWEFSINSKEKLILIILI